MFAFNMQFQLFALSNASRALDLAADDMLPSWPTFTLIWTSAGEK
jgi:hypothetical protein